MYTPEAFQTKDPDEIGQILRGAPLGVLVTHGESGLFASHLPFLFDTASGLLAGHLAHANPHRAMAADGEALVIFQGANAYVSPNWYPSKAEHGRVVPTWNYEAVHVYGRLVWRDDPDWLLSLLRALTDRFEAMQPVPWSVDDAPLGHIERQLAAVVGVEMQISRVEAKRKLSQNRSIADRQGVVAGLAASALPGDRAVAATMLDKLP